MEAIREPGKGNQEEFEENAMNCEMLLSWMTHVGEASWTGFRRVTEEIVQSKRDTLDVCRSLRVGLSDLAFADFFIDGTQRWKILPPVLGGLAVREDAAALYGGRTPYLVEQLKTAATKLGIGFEAEAFQDCPTSFRVVGDTEIIRAIADRIGVAFVLESARRIAERVRSIPCALNAAPVERPPLNWKARSFSVDTCGWVDGLLPNAACEFTPTHGHSRYYVRRKSGKLVRMSKREALYAAAMLKGVGLIEYEPDSMKLSAPVFAPMPEYYTRAACLCACRPAEIINGRFVYSEVKPEVASLLMVGAGQAHPCIAVLGQESRLER